MKFLFILFMADYFLTYYGINIGAIYEGNPLWVAILNLPLYLGVTVRLLYFAIIGYAPMLLAKKYPTLCRPSFIKAYYWILIPLNIGVLGLHIRWLTIYLKM